MVQASDRLRCMKGRHRSDPVVDAYKPGIDRTMLIASLRLTPHERLVNLMALQRSAEELRRVAREDLKRHLLGSPRGNG